MSEARQGKLLRIFIGESDRHDGLPLYEWLVREASRQGMAGATVLRGIEGFGASSRVHSAKLLRLAADLPIIVEIVDVEEKVEAFLGSIDDAVTGGLATVEKADIRFYRTGEDGSRA